MGDSPLHSYFDTTLGYLYFNVKPPEIPELIDVLAAANERRKESPDDRQEYLDLVRGLVAIRFYPLIAHERGHALQAIAYPALFLRCVREFIWMWIVFDELSNARKPISVPLQVPDAWAELLDNAIRRVRFEVSTGGDVAMGEADTQWPSFRDLSEDDLLEDGASIFEYKAEIGGEGTVEGYRLWVKEKGHEARTFDFLARTLSPADAYVAVPCLVMAAYATTQPLRGLAHLLKKTIQGRVGSPSEVGTDSYWAFLQREVTRAGAVADVSDPRRLPTHGGPLLRLDRGPMLDLAARLSKHPFSSVVELAWSQEEGIRRLQEAMLHPTRAFSRERQAAEDWLEPYAAPATAFRIVDERVSVSSTVVEVSPTILATDPSRSREEWINELLELMRIKGFIFAAATPYLRETAHNCPHRECGFHRFDLCHRWINVPIHYEECEFPEWLEVRVKHELDLEKGMLIPVSERAESDG